MAEKESGWTKPEGDGVYWWRQGDSEPPDAVLVRGDVWYDFGDPEPTSISLGKFLGPISPSDAQQLIELRKTGEKTLRLIAGLYDKDLIPPLMQYDVDGIKESLQRVLNPRPEKETQGKQ